MCVIVLIKIDNDVILAKNRDRVYFPQLQAVHEIVNGTEIVYLHDITSGWKEGMNQYGFGVVNSSLNIKMDERDGLNNKPLSKKCGNRVIRLLSATKSSDINDSKLNFALREGHTIIATPQFQLHFENRNIQDISDKKLAVFTNHGIVDKKLGYLNGRKRVSSEIRRNIVYNELLSVNNEDDILPSMRKNYSIDPRFIPYRTLGSTRQVIKDPLSKVFMTSTQLLMNLSKLEFHVSIDRRHISSFDYVNKLPKGYTPKIKVVVKTVRKNTWKSPCPFPEDKMLEIEKKYMSSKTA